MPRKSTKHISDDNILSFSVDELMSSIKTPAKIPKLEQTAEEEAQFLPHIDNTLFMNE